VIIVDGEHFVSGRKEPIVKQEAVCPPANFFEVLVAGELELLHIITATVLATTGSQPEGFYT
jgi:hypothetical protein